MTSKTTTIRFNEDEQKMIDFYMQFQSQPFSTIIKEALLEDIADFFDSMYSEEIILSQDGSDKKLTTKQLLRELDLE